MTEFTDAVARICREELASFRNGQLKETDEAVFRRVGDYWNELAKQPDSKKWEGYNGHSDCEFDTSGRLIRNKNRPWSAAFISFVAAKAGAGDNTDATFDTYIDLVADDKFEAHCDFVVEIDRQNRKLITIGGNVGNSVSQKTWPLDGQGRIGNHDPNSSIAKVICIIECRL